MSYQNVIVGEISNEIDSLVELNLVVNRKLVTTKVCSNHQDELNGDAPFSTYNNHQNVGKLVTKLISQKFDVNEQNFDNQLTIEGFKYLQKYYSINREGERIGVPIDQCTKEELLAKKERIGKMGRACLVHQNELAKYIKIKFGNE